MNIETLNKHLNKPGLCTGALISTQYYKSNEVKKELYNMSGVKSVDGRLTLYKDYLKYMDIIFMFFIIMIVCGAVMGITVIYNVIVIQIEERQREFATLKVLGFRNDEINRIILIESMLLSISSYNTWNNSWKNYWRSFLSKLLN